MGFVAMSHARECDGCVSHVAYPRREINAVRQTGDDESVAVSSEEIGFAALRHSKDDFALPPQMVLFFAGEMGRRLDAPAFQLGKLAVEKFFRG